MLVTNLVNIRYLTGLDLEHAILLLSGTSATLFVDKRYEDIPAEIRDSIGILPPRAFRDVLKLRGRIAVESENIPVSKFLFWKKKYPNKKFVLRSGVIEELRRRKSQGELLAITLACNLTKRILRRIPRMLNAAISERELAWQIECLAREGGAEPRRSRTTVAESMAFTTIVAFGENTARPHHRPTDRKLGKGDLAQIDMGVVVDGYRSDMSRVYFTGPKTLEQSKAFRALTEAKKSAEKLLKPGATNHALYQAAFSVLKKFGIEKAFPHALGHGVGLEIHEGIRLSKKAKLTTLKQHEVVTIEPGVYFPGKWGMRIEDTIIVR